MNLLEVDYLRADAVDVGRRVRVQVDIPEVGTKLVGLDLAERSALGGAGLVGDRVLVALATITVASKDDDTVDFGM